MRYGLFTEVLVLKGFDVLHASRNRYTLKVGEVKWGLWQSVLK